MRSLSDLVSSPDGREFLSGRGVLTEPDTFAARLAPPRDPGLAQSLGVAPERPLVYVGQQTLAEIPASVVAKLRAARDLAHAGTPAAVLWLDSDRTGSTKFATTVTWPAESGVSSTRLVPQRLADREARFAPVDRERLDALFSWLRQQLSATVAGEARAGARARLERLAAEVDAAEPETLAEVNRVLSETLLREVIDFAPPTATVSDASALDGFRRALAEAVAATDELVAVFNETVEALVRLEIDPQVHPLPPDYLPLRLTCSACLTRLTATRSGALATARCSCGHEERFPLGDLDELLASDRWSVDVTLPVYLNDFASGIVAGKSSALYGVVLDQALERVLGRTPVPALVPEELATAAERPGASLLYEFLVGV